MIEFDEEKEEAEDSQDEMEDEDFELPEEDSEEDRRTSKSLPPRRRSARIAQRALEAQQRRQTGGAGSDSDDFRVPAKTRGSSVPVSKKQPPARSSRKEASSEGPRGTAGELACSDGESSDDGFSRAVEPKVARGGMRATSARGITQMDEIGNDDDPEVPRWEEDLEIRRQPDMELRTAFSMKALSAKEIRGLGQECYLLGLPIFDLNTRINSSLLLGAYHQLRKRPECCWSEEARHIGWLARQAERLGVVSHQELRRGRVLRGNLKEKDDADRRLFVVAETRLRFPTRPKSNVSKTDKLPRSQADCDDEGLFSDAEDEMEKILKRKQTMATLRARHLARKVSIRTNSNSSLNVEKAVNDLLAPSLSFDFIGEADKMPMDDDEDDDLLEVTVPTEGHGCVRTLWKDHVKKGQSQKWAQDMLTRQLGDAAGRSDGPPDRLQRAASGPRPPASTAQTPAPTSTPTSTSTSTSSTAAAAEAEVKPSTLPTSVNRSKSEPLQPTSIAAPSCPTAALAAASASAEDCSQAKLHGDSSTTEMMLSSPEEASEAKPLPSKCAEPQQKEGIATETTTFSSKRLQVRRRKLIDDSDSADDDVVVGCPATDVIAVKESQVRGQCSSTVEGACPVTPEPQVSNAPGASPVELSESQIGQHQPSNIEVDFYSPPKQAAQRFGVQAVLIQGKALSINKSDDSKQAVKIMFANTEQLSSSPSHTNTAISPEPTAAVAAVAAPAANDLATPKFAAEENKPSKPMSVLSLLVKSRRNLEKKTIQEPRPMQESKASEAPQVVSEPASEEQQPCSKRRRLRRAPIPMPGPETEADGRCGDSLQQEATSNAQSTAKHEDDDALIITFSDDDDDEKEEDAKDESKQLGRSKVESVESEEDDEEGMEDEADEEEEGKQHHEQEEEEAVESDVDSDCSWLQEDVRPSLRLLKRRALDSNSNGKSAKRPRREDFSRSDHRNDYSMKMERSVDKVSVSSTLKRASSRTSNKENVARPSNSTSSLTSAAGGPSDPRSKVRTMFFGAAGGAEEDTSFLYRIAPKRPQRQFSAASLLLRGR